MIAERAAARAAEHDQAGDRPDHVRRHHAVRAGGHQARSRTQYDCLVFHATGTGGQSMEKLVDSGLLAGVIDVTTTEIADELVGRRASRPGPTRLDAIIRTPRALCRLVRRARHGQLRRHGHGARALPRPQALPAQPERDADAHHRRRRTRAIGEFIAGKLNRMEGPVRFLIPERRRLGSSTRPASRSGIRRPTRRCSPPSRRSSAPAPTAG